MQLLAALTLLLAQAAAPILPAATPTLPAAAPTLPAAAPTHAVATSGTTPSPEPGHGASSRAELAESLAVLRQWDLLRARAWSVADAHALRSLYVPRSAAGRADVRLLRVYTSSGVVVRRLVTQVFAVTVLQRGNGSLRLSVFDRVAGGELVRHGRSATLSSRRA